MSQGNGVGLWRMWTKMRGAKRARHGRVDVLAVNSVGLMTPWLAQDGTWRLALAADIWAPRGPGPLAA